MAGSTRGDHRRLEVVVAAEHIEVTVFCEEPWHERRWDVRRFRSTEVGNESTWIDLGDQRFKSQQRQHAGEMKTSLWLDDEKRYRLLGEAFPEDKPIRRRPELTCKCGLAFVRKDTTVLYAVFDKLAAGKTEISLRRLNRLVDSISS